RACESAAEPLLFAGLPRRGVVGPGADGHTVSLQSREGGVEIVGDEAEMKTLTDAAIRGMHQLKNTLGRAQIGDGLERAPGPHLVASVGLEAEMRRIEGD